MMVNTDIGWLFLNRIDQCYCHSSVFRMMVTSVGHPTGWHHLRLHLRGKALENGHIWEEAKWRFKGAGGCVRFGRWG